MDYVGGFIDGYSSFGGRWTVGGVCCEERPADGVQGHGEDGEDEGDESPAGAEGGDHHGGPRAGGFMKNNYLCSMICNLMIGFRKASWRVAIGTSHSRLYSVELDIEVPRLVLSRLE